MKWRSVIWGTPATVQATIARLVCLIALGALLASCGATTETVATVGGQRITRAELNAQLGAAQGSAEDALAGLIIARLLTYAAQDKGVTITAADLRTQNEADISTYHQSAQNNLNQQLEQLAATIASGLRPIVNLHGGASISDADLLAVVKERLEATRRYLDSRSRIIPVASTGLPDQAITEQAIALRNGLAGRGVAVPPEEVAPIARFMVQQLAALGVTGNAASDFLRGVTASSANGYVQNARLRIILDRLRSEWYKPEIEVASLQQMIVEGREKAQEAVQKGRDGTPFADLVKTYGVPQSQTQPGDAPVATVSLDTLRNAKGVQFKSYAAGEYSEPVALGSGAGTAAPNQFAVIRIASVTRRAPSAEDTNTLLIQWLRSLPTKYPVQILDPSLAGAAQF